MTAELRRLEYATGRRHTGAATRDGSAWQLFTIGLLLVDALALASVFGLAYVIRFWSDWPIFREGAGQPAFYSRVVLWAVPSWLGIFLLHRLYDRRELLVGFREYLHVGAACTTGVLAIIVMSFFLETPSIARAWLLLVWALATISVCSARFLLRRVVRWLRRRGHLVTPTLIVGANEEGYALATQLVSNPGCGAQVLGFIRSSVDQQAERVDGLPVLGDLSDLESILEGGCVGEVIVATTALNREQLLELYRRFAHNEGVELRLSSGLFEILTTGVRVEEINGVPLMSLQRVRITGIDAALKTMLDYAGAICGLLLASPLLLLIAALVRLDSGGPILHRRQVLGRSGRYFDAYKFRTMGPDRRVRSVPIDFPDRRRSDKTENDPRITPLGMLLRRTSLDELPQLLNVLRGEMSLVGPRMIVPEEAIRYGKWQLNLLTVKPGITGPWQVRGRAAIAYDERVQLSMEYIRNYSIWLDFEILLRTVPAVLSGKGAY